LLSSLILDTNLAGSNLAEDDGPLRGIKIRSIPSFGEEVNRRPHVVRFCGLSKILSKYEQIFFVRPNSLFPSPLTLTLLLDDSAVRIAREL
jgi:hypothetical protein